MKIKQVFYLSQSKREKEMISKHISGGQILFIDDNQIDMGSYIKGSIRISKKTKKI